MRLAAILLALTSPALADDLPFAKGDHVLQAMIFDAMGNALVPNPLPQSDWACLRVIEVTRFSFTATVEAGFLDMSPPFGAEGKPVWGTLGTNTGTSSSEPIWDACQPQDPTGFTTVSTTCNMARAYERVDTCKGRKLPPP
jgi:hypothetical protein